MTTDQEVIHLAKILLEYHHMNQELKKSECVLALGSHDLRVAERAADLYLQGWAPLIVFSGGLGNLTKGVWTEPEADQFRRIAIQRGRSSGIDPDREQINEYRRKYRLYRSTAKGETT